MNQDRENFSPPGDYDPMVSAEYRASATEQTPPALDAAILERAREAAKHSGLRGFTALWFRPLAFAATLALSLAIVLQLTSTPEPQSMMETEPGQRYRRAPEAASTATPDAGSAEMRRGTESTAPVEAPHSADTSVDALSPRDDTAGVLRSQKATSATGEAKTDQPAANTAASEAQGSTGFAELVEESSKALPDKNSVVENAVQGIHQTRSAETPPAEAPTTSQALGIVADRASRPCSEEQTADPVQWWKCIRDLAGAGRHGDAKSELELFNKTHPEFEPPDTLR